MDELCGPTDKMAIKRSVIEESDIGMSDLIIAKKTEIEFPSTVGHTIGQCDEDVEETNAI